MLPGPDEPVSFERTSRPCSASRDRQSMRFAFDLWAYDDVRRNAQAILQRVREGSMPCDGAWPRETGGRVRALGHDRDAAVATEPTP